ncbi:MAG: hypothetical protein M0C28_15845 [Candidatus Moduliflexus flocculans]|nr:hypothetical protein [Candidatus Moduliflexus flocculans]
MAGFALFPFICWSTLFLQGLSLTEAQYYFEIMRKFSTSNLVRYFYENYTGFFPTKGAILSNILYAKDSLINFLVSAGYIYFLTLLIMNKFENIIKFKFNTAFQIALFIIMAVFLPIEFIKANSGYLGFSWITFAVTLILIFSLLKPVLFGMDFKENLKEIFNIKFAYSKAKTA